MKVLIINGSPRIDGNTSKLLNEVTSVFLKENIDVELYQVGGKDIRGCIACGYCHKNGKCVFNDDVNELAKIFEEADGLIIASPVYYASANGTLISLLDRLFQSTRFDKSFKVGAAFAIARRSGTTATFDELNKYFTINQMPIASGRYWNNGYGRLPNEINEDKEGLQNARIVAKNMIFLMKSIALGKEKYGLPEKEDTEYTHFIK